MNPSRSPPIGVRALVPAPLNGPGRVESSRRRRGGTYVPPRRRVHVRFGAWPNARSASSTPSGSATSATRSSTTSTPRPTRRSIDDIVAAEVGLCFGPDTLAEARNRGYRLVRRRAAPAARRRRRVALGAHLPVGRADAAGAPGRRRRRARVGANPPARRRSCHGFPGGRGRRAVGRAARTRSSATASPPSSGWLGARARRCGARAGPRATSRCGGWLDDIAAAIAHLRATALPSGIWLAGFGTGGALCVCAAAAGPGDQGRRRPRRPGRLRRLGQSSPGGCSSTPAPSA